MKATIEELWETGRKVISYDGDEFARPSSFTELKKCQNIVIGDSVEGSKIREVLIDNSLELVEPTKVKHPAGGVMYILEVL